MKQILALLTLLVVFTACKKEPTVWDANWSAPIINDTLSLNNLVNDTTLAEVGGFYELQLERSLLSVNVTDVVTIPDTTIKETTTFAGSLSLSPGVNFVNSVEEHAFDLKEVQLKHIILEAGFIDLKLENPLPTKVLFKVALPGVSLSGVSYSQTYEAPAGTTNAPGIASATIDLSGYELDLTGVSGGDFNILKSQIDAQTDPNGPTVTVTPSDVTRVNATFRDVKVSYARGYFGSRSVSDTTDLFLEIMNQVESGSIDVPNTSVTFEVENGLKVSAEGTITTVFNENKSGNVVHLSGGQVGTSFNIDPATGSWNTLAASQREINFNSGNSNIEEYIENLGRKHTFGYDFQLNPWGNVSGSWDELFHNSELNIRMKANMPLSIGIDDLILRDTFDISFNQDPNKTRIKSGELLLLASNGFPISGSVKMSLRDADGVVLHTVVGSEELKSSLYGPVSPQHNFNVQDSEIRFVLSEAVLNDIHRVKDLVVETHFNTVNPLTNVNEAVSIPVGAFLAVKLKTKLTSENKF